MKQEIKQRIEMINRDEVPKGYKQTKIGIIPNEWTQETLNTIRDKNDRYSLTGGPFGSDLKSEHYTESGVRIIQLQNIGDGVFIDKYKIFASDEKANELISCNIYPNEIIIAKMAEPLARACIIPNLDKRYLMASDGIRLKVSNEVNSYYILNLINSSLFRNEAIKRGTGTTRLRIGLSELKKIPFFLPNIKEQQKIGQILSTWDKAIELKAKLIEQKEEQKKALMQKLLTGKMRLPGFHGEWKNVKIKDISKIYLGLTYTPSYISEGIPFLSVKDINGGKINFENVKYISESEYKNSTSNSKPKKGDILFGRVGTLGNPIIITDDIEFCIFVSLGYLRISSDNVLNCFIMHWMNSKLFKKQVQSKIAGSSQKNLNTGWLKEFNISLPPIDEQRKISRILSINDKELELLAQELDLLKQQKKGLMQLLLTGKVRVKS